MAEWLPTALLGLVAVLVLWLPGLAVGYAGGLRGLTAWGTAPLLSSAVIAVSAIAGGMTGVRWSVLVVAAGTAVCAAAVWVLWIATGRWRSPVVRSVGRVRRQVALAAAVSVAVAGAFQARRLVGAFGDPGNFPQTYDTPYHLNSVRLILESGDASSLHMTLTSPEATTTFYPGMWHGLVSLVLETVGSDDVVAGANAVTLVVACLVWPASMLVLARALFGPRPVAIGLTGVLAFAMTQFPNQLTAFGILYPNLVAFAVLPALLALLWFALWRARRSARLVPLALAGVGSLGVLLAQPNGLFTVGYVVVPMLAHYAGHLSLRAWRAGRGPVRAAAPWAVLVVGSVVAYWGAGQVQMVDDFRNKVSWAARQSSEAAITDTLTLAARHPTGTSSSLVAALLVLGALVALLVGRWRWLPFAYLLLGALFVVSSSGSLEAREVLTGYWYGDSQRLAAQLPLIGVPLVVIGAVTVVVALSELARSRGPAHAWWRRGTSVVVLASVLAAGVVLALPRTTAMRDSFAYVAGAYKVPPPGAESNGFVDEDEMALMDDVRRIVPEGSVVAGNPWNGSSMTWALADRPSLFPHAKSQVSDDQVLVARQLGDARDDPAVCEALDRLGVEYVMTSESMLWGRDPDGFEGLEEREVRRVGQVVAREGDVRLWRITACDE